MKLLSDMNMNSTDEFLKAILVLQPLDVPEIEYRLHYNENGDVYMCTMQQHPNNTQYIVVDKVTYDNYYRYTVVDNKLKLIDRPTGDRVQLKKSDQGFCVVKNHASIILEENETYSTVEYYDTVN